MLILKCMHSWSYKHFFLLQCNENPHMYLTSPTSPTAGTPVAVASQEKSWTWKLWQGRPLSSQSIVIQLFWCSCWHFENISCIICVFAKTKYCIFLLKKSICKFFQSNTNDLLHLIWAYFLITCSREGSMRNFFLDEMNFEMFFLKQSCWLYLEWVDFDASFSVRSLYSWEVNNSFLLSLSESDERRLLREYRVSRVGVGSRDSSLEPVCGTCVSSCWCKSNPVSVSLASPWLELPPPKTDLDFCI